MRYNVGWRLLLITGLIFLTVSLVGGCTEGAPAPEPAKVPESTPVEIPETSIEETPASVSESGPETLPQPAETAEEAAPPEEEAVTEEATPPPTQEPEADIPIIDAHSQVCPENIDKVIELMDQAGVACTILSSGMTSTIGIVTLEELVSFASNYPGRIIPAVRIKAG